MGRLISAIIVTTWFVTWPIRAVRSGMIIEPVVVLSIIAAVWFV